MTCPVLISRDAACWRQWPCQDELLFFRDPWLRQTTFFQQHEALCGIHYIGYSTKWIPIYYLVGGLVAINFIFPYIGLLIIQWTNSYFSEGFKPPTSYPFIHPFLDLRWWTPMKKPSNLVFWNGITSVRSHSFLMKNHHSFPFLKSPWELPFNHHFCRSNPLKNRSTIIQPPFNRCFNATKSPFNHHFPSGPFEHPGTPSGRGRPWSSTSSEPFWSPAKRRPSWRRLDQNPASSGLVLLGT